MLHRIGHELKHHAPFTLGGTFAGAFALAVMVYANVGPETSELLFAIAHPAHLFLSAIVTAAIYRTHARGRWWATILVGYVGAVAVGTLSDSLMPYLGELLFETVDRHIEAHAHVGFIELWWLVNPLAVAGAVVGCVWPRTKVPHAGHVLLSTAASLFHMSMSLGAGVSAWTVAAVPAFLFLAVWLPCCTGDIILPLLLVPRQHWPKCDHCQE